MRKTGILCLVISLILIAVCHVGPVSAEAPEQNKTILYGAHTVDGRVPLAGSDKLVENVESAIVYEVGTETLMYTWNADQQVSPASLVKILTAFIVAENGDPAHIVRVKQSTLDTIPYDAATADLVADEELTVEQLLYCMMVSSANDAAAVLAEYVCGTQDEFVRMMNQYASDLGCANTQFTNVHGLHDDEQYTTVRDVVRILSAAVSNDLFRSVIETEYYTVPATNKSESRSLASGNFLVNRDTVEIYYDTRVTGGRTGVTSSGLRCIASTAEYNGMYTICVVTGSKDELDEDGRAVKTFGGYKETSALLDACFAGNKTAQVVYEGQTLAQYGVDNGNADVVVAAMESAHTVLPSNVTSAELSFRYSNVGSGMAAPIEKGQHLIDMEIWYQDVCVAQVPLVAMNSVSVEENYLDYSRKDADGINWFVVLAVVAGIAVLGFAAFIGIRSVRKIRYAAARKRARRYRMSRRRSR